MYTPIWRNWKLRSKLLAAFLFIGLSAVLITGWQSYRSAKAALEQASFNALTAIRETKKRQIESYLDHVRNQIVAFSENRTVVEPMREFNAAVKDLETDQGNEGDATRQLEGLRSYYQKEFLTRLRTPNPGTVRVVDSYLPESALARRLRHHYLVNNPHRRGAKDHFNMAEDGSQPGTNFYNFTTSAPAPPKTPHSA